MRHAAWVAVCLLVIGALAMAADTLPAHCGPVGAGSYTPPKVSIPAVVLNRGTVITVTNTSMLINGDTSSVKALVTSPGPDGISLQEAVSATNNDPGTWVIQFAPALRGSTIVLDSGSLPGLSLLTGGNVTINGDIDGDGNPDITLTSLSGTIVGIYVISGGNTINGLALQHLSYGVMIQRPYIGGQPTATGATLSNVTISNLVITDILQEGIWLFPGPTGGTGKGNTWDHLLITGNNISATGSDHAKGIALTLSSAGDTVQHAVIANNKIQVSTPGALGIDFTLGNGLGSTNNQALDILIANNTIQGAHAEAGIHVGVGLGGGPSNLLDGLEIISNQIQITGPGAYSAQPYGIEVVNGDAASDDLKPPVFPIQYSDNNIARNVSILSNTLGAYTGIFVQESCCGNRNNVLTNLSLLGNSIAATQRGISLVASASGGYYSRTTTGDVLSNVLVQTNSIKVTPLLEQPCNCYGFANGPAGIIFGGIEAWAAWEEPGNSLNGLSIANNDVDTPLLGIGILGGFGGGTPNAPPSPADNNVVSAPQIYCNQVDQTPTVGVQFYPEIKGINVTGGLINAHGNQVQQLRAEDNLVAGVLGDASLLANLAGASGNTISISKISGPANGPQFVTAGLANAASLQQRALAPGSLVSMFGLNLSPSPSVQFDSTSAPIIFTSASQLNLQVPWELQSKSSSSVTVTVNSVTSAPQTIPLAPADPGIFAQGSPQGGQGAIVNLAGLLVNATSPAHAGDTLQIYATGLGAVTNTPQIGAAAVASPLSTLIADTHVTIGGVSAPVSFAGLAPGFIGLFQVNAQVPQGVAAGDALPVTLSTGSAGSNTVTISVR